MSDDFYTFVDSGDPAPDNAHLTGIVENPTAESVTSENAAPKAGQAMYAARIAVYDDMLSTPRVIVVEPQDVRTYLEETTNTVYRCMKEQGGKLSLMVIREIVENFIHAHFAEPIISILDGGNTIRFADQGPGIDDKERAFDFGVTSANRDMKRYIRGTGAGFPMVQEYLENAGGAVSIEDNMGAGTVVTVSLDPKRVAQIERAGGRGAAVRPENEAAPYPGQMMPQAPNQIPGQMQNAWQMQQGMAMQQGVGSPRGTTAPQGTAPQQPYPATPGMQQTPAQEAAEHMGAAPQNPATGAMPRQSMPLQPQQAMSQQPAPATGYPAQQQGYPQGAYQPAGYPQQYGQAYPQQYPQPQQTVPAQYATNQQAYGAWGYQPWPQGYQQPMAPVYGSYQQPPAQMVYPNQANQYRQPAPTELFVTERGDQALRYLAANDTCGPTELTREYGSSASTWSRELMDLAEVGLVIKKGQKFHLTEAGRARMMPPQMPQPGQNPQQ